jgi:hypothetical protein
MNLHSLTEPTLPTRELSHTAHNFFQNPPKTLWFSGAKRLFLTRFSKPAQSPQSASGTSRRVTGADACFGVRRVLAALRGASSRATVLREALVVFAWAIPHTIPRCQCRHLRYAPGAAQPTSRLLSQSGEYRVQRQRFHSPHSKTRVGKRQQQVNMQNSVHFYRKKQNHLFLKIL